MSDDTLARRFHDLYESLAPTFGYTTRSDTKQFDPESPNGKLMIAVCNGLLKELQAENAALNQVIIWRDQDIAKLKEELAEAKKDAERYRWLRARDCVYPAPRYHDDVASCEQIDWSIDKSMAKESKP